MSEIVCTHLNDYDEEQLYLAVKKQFDLLEVFSLIDPGMRILIKPNLLLKRRPDEFTTTHPAVVAAVIRVLKENGCGNIVIADSPGGPYTKPLLSSIYRAAGFEEVAARFGVHLNTETGYQTVRRDENSLCKEFTLIDPVVDADFIIDVCKLKTHGMVGLSGAVKNMFGSIPGLMKPEMHFRFPEEERFCEMLVNLCETTAPGLVVVDGIDGMQGDGPSGGTLLHAGMLLAGTNPYDIDLLLCEIIGFDPEEIFTSKIARARGLSVQSIDELTLLGDEVKKFPDSVRPTSRSVDFGHKLPRWFPKRILDHFSTKPQIVKKGCIGCGKCAESCPAKTIEVVDGKAKIHYEKCIRCFCCHEMCPVKTIRMKRSRFYRL